MTKLERKNRLERLTAERVERCRELNRELEEKIAASDKRIAHAKEVLSAHYRGQCVLQRLKPVLSDLACGLDSQGLEAIQTLVKEFCEGRRGFLE